MNIVTTVKLEEQEKKSLLNAFPAYRFSFLQEKDDLASAMKEADVLVTYGFDVSPELVAQSPRLKWIQVFSAGIDRLPAAALLRQGIVVTNAQGVHAVPMAEYTLSILLEDVRQLPALHEQQKQRRWKRNVPFQELYEKTLVVLGTGAIGQKIAEYAKTFGMHVIGVNTSGRRVEPFAEIYEHDRVNEAMSRGDYVVVVVPLTPATRHWIGGDQLRCMKRDAVFINLSRGDVIVESDLIGVLQERRIRKAVLDVFQTEPLPPDSPFWTLDNCFVTPHIAAISPRYSERCLDIFFHNMRAFAVGTEMVNRVDLKRGY